MDGLWMMMTKVKWTGTKTISIIITLSCMYVHNARHDMALQAYSMYGIRQFLVMRNFILRDWIGVGTGILCWMDLELFNPEENGGYCYTTATAYAIISSYQYNTYATLFNLSYWFIHTRSFSLSWTVCPFLVVVYYR